MPRGTDMVDRLKVSVGVGAAIVVVLVSAMAWFFREIPNRKDIDEADSRATKIVAWVKELDAANKDQRVMLEARISSRLDSEHGDVVRELSEIKRDVKDILSRMPRKLAEAN